MRRSTSDNLDLLVDVPVTAAVRIGGCHVSLKQLLALGVGSTLVLDRLTSDPVDLVVNGRPVAAGHVVTVEDRWSIQLTALTPNRPED